jgi:hypothetical protein
MQRARLALPHLRELGWDPVVLAVEPSVVEGAVLDPLLEQTYPADIPIVRVRGISSRLTRPFGFGSLWWRTAGALRRAGDALLAVGGFDLVFFTTTQFDAFTLGPRWLARFGVPYVLDYQDPWVNDYYHRTGTRPPGGPFKFWLSQFTARRREPAVLRSAAGIVSVSTSYGPDLFARNPGFDPAKFHHLPFGAATTDLDLSRHHRPARPLIPFGDGRVHFVYAGRCGPDMHLSLTLLFRAFSRYRNSHPELASRIRLHFIGTGYAPPPLGRHWVLPVAVAEGVAEQVAEHCYRVPYFDALHYLVAADSLLVVGSDDPTYSASKIFPYLLARRPLLTIVHQHSLMLKLAREQGIATTYGFTTETNDLDSIVGSIHAGWFVSEGYHVTPSGDLRLLAAHTAAGMTRRLAAVFDHAISLPRR